MIYMPHTMYMHPWMWVYTPCHTDIPRHTAGEEGGAGGNNWWEEVRQDLDALLKEDGGKVGAIDAYDDSTGSGTSITETRQGWDGTEMARTLEWQGHRWDLIALRLVKVG
jgi:hypothetical protein